ncbi:hypothetical protein K438DRAFT_1993371 [Mycena galopus ATCC 62051]|nr:hypothetical protein K438DRAFT_1993371 [Mycena galopus ATCC 62051]
MPTLDQTLRKRTSHGLFAAVAGPPAPRPHFSPPQWWPNSTIASRDVPPALYTHPHPPALARAHGSLSK